MVSARQDVKRKTVALAMDDQHVEPLFGRDAARLKEIAAVVDDRGYRGSKHDRVEVLITGWGAPTLRERDLDEMPSLRAILHAAGSVKSTVAADPWARGIVVASAAAANAIPVAEYTLAMIILAGKRVEAFRADYARRPTLARTGRSDLGNFKSTVGIIGASRIGRRVIDLLQALDVNVLLADPTVSAADPVLGQVRLVGLQELARLSNIVSVHAPSLPETVGMIGREFFETMQPGSTIINTSRGDLIDERALGDCVVSKGISAVLDVTRQEPLPLNDPLRRLVGVTLTPHVAGAQGNELRRLGDWVLEDLRLVAHGYPPQDPINRQDLTFIA